MADTGSIEFDRLLAHFFGNEKAVLSAPAAAGLSGLPINVALSAMELLETAGILRAGRGRRRFFSSNARSRSYRSSRLEYLIRR